MSVDSVLPTSRRGYLSRDELEQFANITITDTTEADDRISQAEEIIDAYVGHHCKFVEEEIFGRASTAASASITIQTDQQNIYEQDYFKLCEVEIIGGTGAGQRRKITGSTKAGVLTVDTAWETGLDTTSFYRIYQLGKFPRQSDGQLYSQQSPSVYYKAIPEAVKRAVAAQVAFLIEMGDGFFNSDGVNMQREKIGDYEYETARNGSGVIGAARLIAPQAKILLRGYINRTGKILL